VQAPEDLTDGEARAFEEMAPALRDVALKMRNLMRSELLSVLDSRYELGSVVLDVKANPETYGAMSDVHLADFFGEGTRAVYAEARRVRERYPPDEFAKLKAAMNPVNGARISFTHLAVLLRIENPAVANRLLNDCLAAGWSTKELAAAVSKKLRELSGRRRRPSRSRPTNLLGVLENVAAVGGEFRRHFDESLDQGQVLIDAFNALPEEKIDEELIKRLEEAQHLAESIAEGQCFLADEIGHLMRRAEDVISGRQQRGAEPAGVPKEGDVEDDDPDADEAGR
jgi:hypothetical protein